MVSILSNPKKIDEIEKAIDRKLEKLFSNPTFLQSVSMLLNANSYRKIMVNYTLTQFWKGLQLPNKRDQERTLHLIHELNHRIDTLKEEIDRLSHEVSHESSAERDRPSPIRRVPRRAKPEMAASEAPHECESVAIQ